MDELESPPRGGASAAPTSESGRGPSGSDGCRLFGWLWSKLSSSLGTPAAAALLRRAVSVAAAAHPELRGIAITRERLTYSYRLPEALCADDLESAVPAYRALLREVIRVTGELTGGVMVRGLIVSSELSPWLPDTQEVDRWLKREG